MHSEIWEILTFAVRVYLLLECLIFIETITLGSSLDGIWGQSNVVRGYEVVAFFSFSVRFPFPVLWDTLGIFPHCNVLSMQMTTKTL